jgi:hypothetical protein
MRIAKELLEQLTERFIPGRKQRHNLTLDNKGQLEVTLMLGEQYLPIVLEDADLDLGISDLVDEICRAIMAQHGELP